MKIPRALSPLKEFVKQGRHSLRNWYVRRFLAFTPADFLQALRSLGIRPGDLICVHSSFDRFLGFTGNVGDALKILQEAVGEEGGLMMPTQPFGGSAIDYVRAHPVTNIARTLSQVGMITELLRRTKGAVRSIHPTHPVALWGKRGTPLADRDYEATTPCGKGTAYARLLDQSGKILLLGTGAQPITFYHFVEELIEPLMPFSPFTDEVFELTSIDAAGRSYATRTRLLDPGWSARRKMYLMVPELKKQGFWREARIGRLELILLDAADIVKACVAMARRGEFCYEGAPGTVANGLARPSRTQTSASG